MLGVIASIALLVGGIQAAVVATEVHNAAETKTPVVQVQGVQTADTVKAPKAL